MSKFFYLLKGTLYRSADNPEDLVEINEVFQNDNPIEARERAFEMYQNYLDVILEGKDMKYESHKQAFEALHDFLKSDKKEANPFIKELFGKPEHDFDKGLGVYLVMSDSKTFTTFEGELIYEGKTLIHDLNSSITGLQDHMFSGLLNEYELYKRFGYDCKDYEVTFAAAEKNAKNTHHIILKTPINHSYKYLLKHL